MVRQTKQKTIIADILCSTKSHPSAEWVYSQARKLMPNISLGTVYRNLNELVESGKAITIETTDSSLRYDATTTPHTHFVCNTCKGVYDVDVTLSIDTQHLENQGFIVQDKKLVLYGVCDKCSQSNVNS